MTLIKKNILKLALGVEYDGSIYHGWQRQKSVSSIQEEVEKALSIIANHTIHSICAGRTDTGVHSTGQVIHFETTSIRTNNAWTFGVNSYLPKYISIIWVKKVPEDFNARHSAISRSYRYIIYNFSFRSSLFCNRSSYIYKKLNANKMNIEAQFLLGEHDFSSFRGCNCQSHSPWRKIKKLHVWRYHDWVIIDITANSFVYHMVRNIVGSLIEIGTYKKKYNMKELLQKKNRIYAGPTASSKGLYLVYVEYPVRFNLPKSPFFPIFFK